MTNEDHKALTQMAEALRRIRDEAATKPNGGAWAAGIANLCLASLPSITYAHFKWKTVPDDRVRADHLPRGDTLSRLNATTVAALQEAERGKPKLEVGAVVNHPKHGRVLIMAEEFDGLTLRYYWQPVGDGDVIEPRGPTMTGYASEFIE